MKDTIKKTKIICTIGPVSESEEMLKQLVEAGMNIIRMNFSHGSHEEHLKKIVNIRKINKELGSNVAVLLDTKGPEIRTGSFESDKVEFTKGSEIIIRHEDVVGNSHEFSITYKDLYKDVEKGSHILVDDGKIDLIVRKIEGKDIVTTCINHGFVKDKRGINVPGTKLNFEYLSEKDIADIKFGCEQDIDFIAASFVRRANDVIAIRKLLEEFGKPYIKIISKIENQEGIDNMDEIIAVTDGIMVARGDLGVEVPAEFVPGYQKKLIKACNAAGKYVVTATQMLESMQHSSTPTRAEVSDVANAIYDGTDCIMLSGESANGEYPRESVDMMASIAVNTEKVLDYPHYYRRAERTAPKSTAEAICLSVAKIALDYDVAGIIAYTDSGLTARAVARYKPKCLLIGATPNTKTLHQLQSSFGVIPYLCETQDSNDALKELAHTIAKEHGIMPGQTVIVTGGTVSTPGSTNFIELIKVK